MCMNKLVAAVYLILNKLKRASDCPSLVIVGIVAKMAHTLFLGLRIWPRNHFISVNNVQPSQ